MISKAGLSRESVLAAGRYPRQVAVGRRDLAARGPGGRPLDRGGPEPLPATELAPGLPPRAGNFLISPVASETPLAAATLHLTRDRGEWKRRSWESLPARLAERHVEAPLPAGAAACFLTVEDREGYLASSPHEEIGPAPG